jgi:ABC-2 type transport system ATP-binding protein
MALSQQPSGLKHIYLIAVNELSKRFTQGQGLVALFAFSLIWGLILLFPIKEATVYLLDPSFKQLTMAVFGPNVVDELFMWPVAEFALFWCVGLYLFPMFSIFISADQFSSDKHRGTFRFYSLRVSRDSLFFGRFLGQMLIQLALISLTVLATLALALSRDPSLWLAAISSGLYVLVNIFIVLLPYTAVMALFSLYAKSARQATIFAVILWALVSLSIAIINSQFPSVDFLQWALPGSQIISMMNTQGIAALLFAPIPLLQTLIILFVGYGDKLALDKVSLSLSAGAPIGLVGPNGAGKTTLFSLLCGYILPTEGDVRIMGHKAGSSELLGLVSALPQDAALDPNLTVVEQLSFFARLQGIPKAAAKEEALRVLALVDLTSSAKLKPKSLSHGMGKRVAIAQALIGEPKLVLLDEPTAGLDPVNAKLIRQIVKSQSNNTQFVISSHNLEELEKLCDQIVYLEQGKLAQSVSLAEQDGSKYLTLIMKHADYPVLISAINALPSVLDVNHKDQQLLISYQAAEPYELEQALLALFSRHQWQYKMLLKGRSLEDTLFA